MKKFFTLIAAAVLGVLSMNAADYKLSLTELGTGWGSSYDAATKTITYEDAWKGRGWWLDGQDLSAYDKVVIEFEPLTIGVQLVVEYGEKADLENESNTAEVGDTKIEILLSSSVKDIKQIYLQNRSTAGTVVLKDAYLTSDSGELSDFNLSLTTLGSGWSSSYDAATKTITFDDAWTGRGWWFSSEGQDFSDYNRVVVETQPLTIDAKLVVEYNAEAGADLDGESITANVGDTIIQVDLTSEKKPIKQIYLQGNAAGTITLKSAYLTYAPYEVSLGTINYNEDGVYDRAAQTIYYTKEAQHVGWRFAGKGSTFAGKDVVVIEFAEPLGEKQVSLWIDYADGAMIEDQVISVTGNDVTKVESMLDGDSPINHILLRSTGADTIKLKNAYLANSTGIQNATVTAENANAPIYNLAGQQVSKAYKGMVIQNGKKFILK